MIKIKVLAVGKIKERFHLEAINELLKRLSRFAEVKIEEVEEYKISSHLTQSEIIKANDEEAKFLLKRVKDSDYVIALDLWGHQVSSEEFAKNMQQLIDSGQRQIVFIIGGSYGLGDKIRKRAAQLLSLSKMTFTHQMTRVIILEQIYRSFKINNNEGYHK